MGTDVLPGGFGLNLQRRNVEADSVGWIFYHNISSKVSLKQ